MFIGGLNLFSWNILALFFSNMIETNVSKQLPLGSIWKRILK